jgi:hypothetical protein
VRIHSNQIIGPDLLLDTPAARSERGYCGTRKHASQVYAPYCSALRTQVRHRSMSVPGQSRRADRELITSALPRQADMPKPTGMSQRCECRQQTCAASLGSIPARAPEALRIETAAPAKTHRKRIAVSTSIWRVRSRMKPPHHFQTDCSCPAAAGPETGSRFQIPEEPPDSLTRSPC